MTKGAADLRFNAAFIVSCKHTSAPHRNMQQHFQGFCLFLKPGKTPRLPLWSATVAKLPWAYITCKTLLCFMQTICDCHRPPPLWSLWPCVSSFPLKMCSKWMLRKFWKLQGVDLNQPSRRLHENWNMFETIISQEILLKRWQPLFFSCPGQADSRFYVEWAKTMTAGKCLHCPISAAINNVTILLLSTWKAVLCVVGWAEPL